MAKQKKIKNQKKQSQEKKEIATTENDKPVKSFYEQKSDMSRFSFYNKRGKMFNAQSSFFNPFSVSEHSYMGVRTISRIQFGGVMPNSLRAIAQKAWIINICINHVLKKIKPFLKPTTDNNRRGFHIVRQDGEEANEEEVKKLVFFIQKCGKYEDPERDSFIRYGAKIIRDLLTIDQLATELQRNNKGEVIAFFAVDAGTIERVLPDIENGNKINEEDFKFLQIVEGAPVAAYKSDELIFDFENPRTDIYHSMYGYSYVEQAIELVTGVVNTLAYNLGNFTENRLPKGMLLLNGDVSPDVVEQMEDYIAELLSAGPLNQWRIPIIPSGTEKGGIEWKELNGKNREMEFQQWLDFLTSAIVAMYGCSMDELGLQSQKSQVMFENGGGARISASKGLILGDTLSFIEDYMNKIMYYINPEYKFEFVGYEVADPKAEADLLKTKLESFMTINEARETIGLEKLEFEWCDWILNPQTVQIYQSEKAQSMDGGEGEEMGGDDDWQNYGNEESEEDSTNYDENENVEDSENTETEEEPQEENAEIPEDENIGKSLNKSLVLYL